MFKKIIFYLMKLFHRLYAQLSIKEIKRKIFFCGENVSLSFPLRIEGLNNCIFEDDIYIGPNATIYSTRAKFIIKKGAVISFNFSAISGDHMIVAGRTFGSITDIDKESSINKRLYDQDIIINDEVWIGANVTILKGVVVGRGAVIAAGSVVIRNVPPYQVWGGVPAKFIKNKWNKDEILYHESILYQEEYRISTDIINSLFEI
jgi:acetyltransferase-like isoleucine patch superfamily enzyme